MRIMFLSDYVPYPLISGAHIRVYNLMRRVAESHEVWLAGLVKPEDRSQAVAHLETFCARVEAVELLSRSRWERVPRKLAYTFSGIPPSYEFVYSQELSKTVRDMTAAPGLDIVEVEDARMAIYTRQFPVNGSPRRILTLYDVDQYHRIQHADRTGHQKLRTWLHSRILRRWEPRQAEKFDRCITVSEVDRRILLQRTPKLTVDIVPNGVDSESYRPLPADARHRALLLVGNMAYAPNVDGAIWLCQEILPRIRELVGEIELWIVGTAPTPEVVQLDGNGVHVTGQVADVVPYYEQTAVSLVPLRGGSGTRLKILESMALGRPVVSTSVGCEGLDVVEGRHLLIADDPDAFAQKTARLLADNSLYTHIVTEGRQLVETTYDWNVIAAQLLRVYHDVTQPRQIVDRDLRWKAEGG